MDYPHLHLLLNHIPILGTVFGVVLLGIGLVIKNRSVEVTALVTLAIVALLTIPAYTTGEEAEHVVEHIQGISEHELEEHEEHAELSLWLMLGAGVLAILTLISYRGMQHLRKIFTILTLVGSSLAFLSLIPLALHGGKIVHSELRGDAPAGEDHHEEHEAEHAH